VSATAADSSATVPAGSPPPAPAVFTWQAIPELSDEFNGNALDQTKWLPKIPYWNGREPSAHDPANVSVEDGMLHPRNTTRVTTLDGIKNPEKDLTALRPAYRTTLVFLAQASDNRVGIVWLVFLRSDWRLNGSELRPDLPCSSPRKDQYREYTVPERIDDFSTRTPR